MLCMWCGAAKATLVLTDATDASGPAGQVVCVECTGTTSATFRTATADELETAGPCEIQVVAKFDNRVNAEEAMAAIEEVIGRLNGDLEENTLENV